MYFDYKWDIIPTMAFVVPRKNGTWEIRESRTTGAGPRSRTLATFRELTDDVLARAQDRADRPLDHDELRGAALRAGAPVAPAPIDRAAQRLIYELSRGRKPRRGLRRLLASSVDSHDAGLSDAALAVQEWIGVSPKDRGETLRELLLLADALPQGRRPDRIEFPRLTTA